jgi:dolichyl-phosphate beta-glucosyltransferase
MANPKQGEIHLSVVVPAYDEEERIGRTLAAIRSYLERRPYSSEVIVVDDGSRDRTAALAARSLSGLAGARVLARPVNRGKGFSVKEGVLASRGAYVLFSDADLSTPIEELDKFWPRIEDGCDVVIGSRALAGADIQVRQNPVRELMGKTFNLFVRLLFFRGIPDTQCGFKLFKRTAARDVFPRVRTAGFSFDVEVLDLCRRAGYKIGQVPVVWRNSPRSKVRILGSPAAMLLDLVRIRLRFGRGARRGPSPRAGGARR